MKDYHEMIEPDEPLINENTYQLWCSRDQARRLAKQAFKLLRELPCDLSDLDPTFKDLPDWIFDE